MLKAGKFLVNDTISATIPIQEAPEWLRHSNQRPAELQRFC
ncbi:MAG TPA: hypothetical protein VK670_09010 [Silvibacterium sp.]|nr:hypothetical protein [Silvibacterium sp.]